MQSTDVSVQGSTINTKRSIQVEDSQLDFRNKTHLVDELARRWWYSLPEWPPANYSYAAALKEVGFREVDASKFKIEPEFGKSFYTILTSFIDANHLLKVTQLESFSGVFRDSEGAVYDFRPAEGKPTIHNFQRMELKALQAQLLIAYQNQRKALDEVLAGARPYDRASETQLVNSLSEKIGKLEKVQK